MRLRPLITGVDVMKVFDRGKLVVRAIARSHGSPSPPPSPGYALTSSKPRYRADIERRPLGLLAPTMTKIPPGKSFASIVLPESRARDSFTHTRNMLVPS